MRNFFILIIFLLGIGSKNTAQTVSLQNGYSYAGNIDYTKYVHTVFNKANSIGVMGLTLKDNGSDGLPTVLTSITFSTSALSGNAISIAAIYANGAKIDTFIVANGATAIPFTHGVFPAVANGDSLSLELRVMFKTAIIDNQQMQFTVSSVAAAAGGSSFSSPDGGGATSVITGNINKISVTATALKFGQQPTDIFAGQVINPSVTVKAVDKNNNVDSDYVTPVKLDIANSIPSCDTLAGNLVTPVSGIATFPNLTPNVADFGVILTTVSALTNALSSAFDVNSAQIKTLINWNFSDNNTVADGGTNSNYLTKTITTTATGAIGYGSCGCIGDHSPGAYSTGWDNGSGNKYWQIDFSSLGYWNIKVSSRLRSSPTGPANFKVQYKVGSSGVWMNISTLPSLADSFKTTSVTIPELDTASHVYVKWIMSSNTSVSGGVVDSDGQNFIDDIVVSGTAITLAKQLNYRSKSSGDFESSCNWESATSPAGPWTQAHGSPDFSAYGIEIQPGHIIAINQTVRLDQVVVDPGATLVLNKGQLYISGGGSVAGTSGLIIKGTFIDNTSGSNVGLSFNTGNSWKLDSTGTFIKTGNSNPRPLRDFFNNGMSTIPATANWIIRYTGVNSPAFTTDSTFYPNLTFESTSGVWNPGATTGSYFSGTTADGAFATIKGNLDIGGTGNSGTVKISNVSPNQQPLLVQGNTIVRAGNELNNILGASYGTGFEIKGNLAVDGTFTVNGGGNGILKMSGAALQTLSGNGTINLQNLSVANTGSGVSVARDLTIGGTDSLINGMLDPGVNTLTLSGPVIRTNGNINGKLSTTIFNGTSPQTIPANAFLNNSIKNLTIANNVSLAGQDTISGTLNVAGNNKVFATNNNLTLKSTATGTANVAQIMNGNSITGDVTVERYISAKRAWRFLSIPTNTSQTVKQAWQEGALSTNSIPVPGYGTQVTDKSDVWSVNGFDYYSPDGPSVKKYSSSANSWVGISTTSEVIQTTEGLMTFVRGDRRSTGVGATPYATVLRTKGPLYMGSMPAITVNAGQFASIGNPYASVLDLRNITKSGGVNDFFYVWDPYLANSNGNGFGAFQTLAKIGVDYYATPGGGSYPAVDASGNPVAPSNYIESGQAFFVYSASGGTLTFSETAKAGANTNPLVFRPVSVPAQHLRTNLYAIETDGSATLSDAVLNDYSNEYNNEIDESDAVKATNTAENLAIKEGDKLLTIERRHTISFEDTIQLNMLKMKVKAYQFEFIANDFTQPGLTAFLEDSYFNTRTPIDLNGNTKFSFNVINVPGSWNPDRFRIVFKAASPLPVTFSVVKAYQADKNISVEWKVEAEKNVKQYVIEKSVNGQEFSSATTVAAKNNNNSAANYYWIDINPVLKNNYYRIKSIGEDEVVRYSNIVKVFIGSANSGISVYPNPVVNGVINLQLTNQPKGIYDLKLLNKAGQVVQISQVSHSDGNGTETLQINKALPHGSYQLQVTRPDNSQLGITLLYQ